MTSTVLLLALLLTGAAAPPAKTTVCTPAGVKKPSLMMPDSKGHCASGYKGMDTPHSKDKKVMYCVRTEHPQPATCKSTAPVMAKPQ